MKELENKKELNEVEEEKVAGGRGDGLPTIFNPGPDVTKGQKKDIVTDPGNNLYPPLGRHPLPVFPDLSDPLPHPNDKSQGLPDNPITDTPDFPFV